MREPTKLCAHCKSKDHWGWQHSEGYDIHILAAKLAASEARVKELETQAAKDTAGGKLQAMLFMAEADHAEKLEAERDALAERLASVLSKVADDSVRTEHRINKALADVRVLREACQAVLREVHPKAAGMWPGMGDCFMQVRKALASTAPQGKEGGEK